MKTRKLLLILGLGSALAILPSAWAGTISANFTSGGAGIGTPPTVGGTVQAVQPSAILGLPVGPNETWNILSNPAGSGALSKNDGTVSAVTLTAASPGGISTGGSLTNAGIQQESWCDTAAAHPPITVTFSGLLAQQLYMVAIYTDRGSGTGNGSDSFTVNGVAKTATNPGAAAVPLPGVEGVDYLLFKTTATATGQIVMTGPCIAAIQVQGVLAGEIGPQMDCRITKSRTTTGGKGNGVYAIATVKNQTRYVTVKGRRAAKLYVNVENDGKEIDNCYMMLFYNKRHVKVKVKDRTAGKNATSKGFNRNYRYHLEPGKAQNFQVRLKRKAKRRRINVRVCASPSTLAVSRQDCSTAQLRTKGPL